MFLYEKKIEYLTLFQEGIRKSSAGFVRIARERDACRLDIHIKRITGIYDGSYALFLVLKNREMPWGTLIVKGGEAAAQKEIPVRKDMFLAGEEQFPEDEFCGILVQISAKQWISCYWKDSAAARVHKSEEAPETMPVAEKGPGGIPASTEKVHVHAADDTSAGRKEGRCGRMPEGRYKEERPYRRTVPEEKRYAGGTLEDKWAQLQENYKKVHPFEDERVFLSIELKDFHFLRAPYQRLANNSFLLHGFYNYGHLIFGPDREMGGREGLCFYLGVPGTYFEREKMVAVMFGFEGFECSGAVEIGKFGYYMRRVEMA